MDLIRACDRGFECADGLIRIRELSVQSLDAVQSSCVLCVEDHRIQKQYVERKGEEDVPRRDGFAEIEAVLQLVDGEAPAAQEEVFELILGIVHSCVGASLVSCIIVGEGTC